MTDFPPDKNHDRQYGTFTILAWTCSWGLMGAAIYLSGVLNSPHTGTLWVALAGGAIPWSLAGAFTFRAHPPLHRLKPVIFLVWALAYLLSFGLAGYIITSLNYTSYGLFILTIGWAIGPGAGAFASTWLTSTQSRLGRSSLAGLVWMLAFIPGAYLGLIGGYVGPELAKLWVGPGIGMTAALTLGFGLGCALGGLAASALAFTFSALVIKYL